MKEHMTSNQAEVSLDNVPRVVKDDNLERTGTLWTAVAHIITAVIGGGVLSLSWVIAQLGWIAGPIAIVLFSLVTYFAASLQAACYRAPDSGKRNYTYVEAVRSHLGEFKLKFCETVRYVFLFGTDVGYVIGSATSMLAIQRSHCLRTKGESGPCRDLDINPYMIAFGVLQIFLSQIPNYHHLWWLSTAAAAMSFTYSTIGLALGCAKFANAGKLAGSLTGTSMVITQQNIWRTFQSLGAIAFSYSFSPVLIEIQDTLKSPPSNYTTMKKASMISIAATSAFYLLCGCFGYAAFGDSTPENLLTGFGSYNPFRLVDIANVAIVIHLIGAYQVFCQPLFTSVEMTAAKWFPHSQFIVEDVQIPIPGFKAYRMNVFRMVWRTAFVTVTTVISIVLPFFADIIGFIGALGFWPLTVYFPVEMYIVQKKIGKWSSKWMYLQIVSITCLIVSVAAAIGSFAGIISHLQEFKPFKSRG